MTKKRYFGKEKSNKNKALAKNSDERQDKHELGILNE